MSKITRAELCQLAQKRSDELIKLTSDLIKIPSENPTGSQRKVVDFVENYLKDAGIAYEEVGPNPDYPCVVAKIGTEEGFSILINGHVDVVPAGDLSRWDYDPYCGEVTDKLILGRGTSDMKAGVAAALHAMRLLKESGAEMKGNIRLHIVSDEETGGVYGTKWLCENGYADGGNACLVAEPTGCDNIEIGQKGTVEITLKAYGQPAHGSIGNYVGDNAINKLAKVLSGGFSRLTKIEGHYQPKQATALANSKKVAKEALGAVGVENVIDHVTANVGIISGGTKINMVPDYAQAEIDMRIPIGVDKDEILRELDGMIADSGVEGVKYDILFKTDANYTDDDAAIVQTIKKNAESIWGLEVLPAYQWASSDAKHYRTLGIPTIQYGPSNTEGIHSYNENVDIQDVKNASLIYILAFCDMLGIE